MENNAPIWIVYMPEYAHLFVYVSGYECVPPAFWDYRVAIYSDNWGYWSTYDIITKAIRCGVTIDNMDEVIMKDRTYWDLIDPKNKLAFWEYRPYWPVPDNFPRRAFGLFWETLKAADAAYEEECAEYEMKYFDTLAGFDPWLKGVEITVLNDD